MGILWRAEVSVTVVALLEIGVDSVSERNGCGRCVILDMDVLKSFRASAISCSSFRSRCSLSMSPNRVELFVSINVSFFNFVIGCNALRTSGSMDLDGGSRASPHGSDSFRINGGFSIGLHGSDGSTITHVSFGSCFMLSQWSRR